MFTIPELTANALGLTLPSTCIDGLARRTRA